MREDLPIASLKSMCGFLKKKVHAFSLPEILLTTGIIGFASVVVLGVANKEITTQTMNTQRTLTNNEIAVALADMQAEGRLAGYKDQESFNSTFKKFYSVEPIPQGDMEKRFAAEYKGADGSSFKSSDYQNSVVTPSGVSLAYTYNTSCTPQYQFAQDSSTYKKIGNNYTYIAKNEALSCIKGFFDINGAKGPNEIGKDVMPITEFAKDCKDKDGNLTNFIPNAYGNCPNDENKNDEDTLFPAANVCSLMEQNCKANGSLKTLDRNKCACVCKLSCPRGQALDKENCKCSCNTADIEKNICKTGNSVNPYADCEASKNACTCMPKNPNAKKLCESNGGDWNNKTCRCECSTGRVKQIAEEFNNLARADENDFCVAKCIYGSKTDAFKNQVNINAQKTGLVDSKVVEITDVSTIEDLCFKCDDTTLKNDANLKDSAEAIKVSDRAKGGFCRAGCITPSDAVKNQYKTYFEWLDYNPAEPANSCKWSCKKGENEGVTKRAKDLNNDSSKTTAKILNADKSTDLTNYKLAQYHYFEAVVLGKARSEHTGYYGDGKDHDVNVNGTIYKALRPYSCEDRGCGAVYRAFQNNDSVFAGFLKYGANTPSTAPEYGFGWKDSASVNDYKIKYTANTETCTIETTGFNFGTSPTRQIPYHSAGIDRRKWEMVTFDFTPILNSDLALPNPNKDIIAPDTFKKQGGDDDTWKRIPIGVMISYRTQYDPLALNISEANPNADPEVDSPETVSFPLVYDSKTKNYSSINVNWPKENLYRFVVNNNFKNGHRHIGNMFSDQVSNDGHQYNTGFDQLAAQHDTNNDNIITRDEMKDKLYLWNRANSTYTALDSFVLDINLNKWAVSTDTGSAVQTDNIVFDIQGEYRRLIALNSRPVCSNETCIKYIGYDRAALNTELRNYISENIEVKDSEGKDHIAELWQDINNSDVYYYVLRTINGTPTRYANESWYKITKTQLAENRISGSDFAALTGLQEVALSSAPDEIRNKQGALSGDENTTVKLYKDASGSYYVVKEKTVTKNNEPPQTNGHHQHSTFPQWPGMGQGGTWPWGGIFNSSNQPDENDPQQTEDDQNPSEDTSQGETAQEPEGDQQQTGDNQEPSETPQEPEAEEQAPQTETTIETEIIKYDLSHYNTTSFSGALSKYFVKDNKWYSVVVARVTDIIFKYNR